MRAKTMHTSALGTVVFAAALASTWIGCVTDVTPQKTFEKTGETSAAVTDPPPYQCPQDIADYWNVVYANPHYAGFVVPSGQTKYTDSAPTPCAPATGSLFSCSTQPGSDIHSYEDDLYNDVTNSNGYEYVVSVPLLNDKVYVGVGIQRASGTWSMTPPAPPGNLPGGGPSAHDYNAEIALQNNPPNTSNVAAFTPLECVVVRAMDTGEVLNTFVLMDLHDPDQGGWLKP